MNMVFIGLGCYGNHNLIRKKIQVVYKGNKKITELRTILQRESQNSEVYKQTKSVNNRNTVKTALLVAMVCYLNLSTEGQL